MNQIRIDVNADVGEGIGNETELMPYLSSCNIACGGHAGNPEIIKTVIKLAKKYDVKIGAHPSFPDLQNFGRKEMNLPTNQLVTSLKSQINEVLQLAKNLKVHLHHVKPHGALYNLAAKNTATAKLLVEIIKSFKEPLCLYVPPNSKIEAIAIQEGIPIRYEVFIDRAYNDDYSLVSRKQPNALLVNLEDIISHSLRMIHQQKIKTISGNDLNITPDTYCIHGDHPNAVAILSALKERLLKLNIVIE